MAKRNWSADRIVSISAIIISLSTLIVFIYQTRLMAEQQRLSVMPYVTFGLRNTGGPNFTLFLSNDGIGPAFIESTKVFYQDTVYDMDFPNFLYSEIDGMDSIRNVFHSNINPGQLLPAGRIVDILQVDNSMENANKLLHLLDTLDCRAEIIYQSAYKERWLLTSDTFVPEKID